MRAKTPDGLSIMGSGYGVDDLDIRDMIPYMSRLDELDEDTLKEILILMKKLETADIKEKSKEDFLTFVKAMWPQFIGGTHHKIMADAFERLAEGKIRRLCISMPPRFTKSEFSSYLLPAWWLGRFPSQYIIQASNTSDLATSFGRKVRDLVGSGDYQQVFPGTKLRPDAKAAGQWLTAQGGTYYAVGVGGAIAGRGADLCIIDDPVTDQQGMSMDPKTFEETYEWYTTGPRQRLQPGGRIVIVMTRWSKGDLIGRILKKAAQDGDISEWEVIELPAILPSGQSLWPEYWPIEELEAIKKEIPVFKWNAQYMQAPSGSEGAIVKKDWWKRWTDDKPPKKIDFIIQSWDTAHTVKTYSDYSAVTTWGVFYKEDETGKLRTQVILIDAEKWRLEFPELKQRAKEKYKKYQPDCLIIEGKAAGLPLISELRAMGIPVEEFSPSRGNDKIVRINAVADLFASGIVWAPERRFADEVIEEFADFPNGECDDFVDSGTQALLRFRQGGFISLATDYDDEDEPDDYVDMKYY